MRRHQSRAHGLAARPAATKSAPAPSMMVAVRRSKVRPAIVFSRGLLTTSATSRVISTMANAAHHSKGVPVGQFRCAGSSEILRGRAAAGSLRSAAFISPRSKLATRDVGCSLMRCKTSASWVYTLIMQAVDTPAMVSAKERVASATVLDATDGAIDVLIGHRANRALVAILLYA